MSKSVVDVAKAMDRYRSIYWVDEDGHRIFANNIGRCSRQTDTGHVIRDKADISK